MSTILPVPRPPTLLPLIDYGDFSCPRCRELQQLLTTILPLFEGEISYVFRQFPSHSHPSSLLMAMAAEAARRQDKYWAMHRELFAQTAPASLNVVVGLAAQLGLEVGTFLNDMQNETLKEGIWAEREQGRLAGVVSVPALFLGTRRLHGKLSQARLAPLMRHYVDRLNVNVLSTIDRKNGSVRWSGMGYS